MAEKPRVNISISNELKEWYTSQAEAFGCSVSSMMAIALAQYKQNMESMSLVKQLPEFLSKLQDMAKEVKKIEKI